MLSKLRTRSAVAATGAALVIASLAIAENAAPDDRALADAVSPTRVGDPAPSTASVTPSSTQVPQASTSEAMTRQDELGEQHGPTNGVGTTDADEPYPSAPSDQNPSQPPSGDPGTENLDGALKPQTLLIEGNFQSYSRSAYNAYTGMWGHYVTDDLQAESSMRVAPAVFPYGTVFTWDVTPASDWAGVNGYLHVSYGNYADSPGMIPPRQLDGISDLAVTIDWTLEGDEASGLLAECWLTSVAAPSGPFDATHEVGFFPKLSPAAMTFVDELPAVGAGSFVDSGGVTWNVVEALSGTGEPYFVAYRPGHLDFTGTLQFDDLFSFLITSGELTGDEWFNGVAFGVEPHSGAGSLTVEKFAPNYAGA